MKKSTIATLLAVLAVTAASALTAYGGTAAGSGVVGSMHDITAFAKTQASGAVTADNEGRVCIYCHTPHAANLDGVIGPLWSHTLSSKNYTPYKTATFDTNSQLVLGDTLIGSSRLCMSCHDGQVAADSHQGSTPQDGTFVLSGSKVVGSETSSTSDHPIGFLYDNVQGQQPTKYRTSTTTWISGNGQTIAACLEGGVMTCNTCHEVHNKRNVTMGLSVDHTQKNWLLRAKETNSAICRSCHNL